MNHRFQIGAGVAAASFGLCVATWAFGWTVSKARVAEEALAIQREDQNTCILLDAAKPEATFQRCQALLGDVRTRHQRRIEESTRGLL